MDLGQLPSALIFGRLPSKRIYGYRKAARSNLHERRKIGDVPPREPLETSFLSRPLSSSWAFALMPRANMTIARTARHARSIALVCAMALLIIALSFLPVRAKLDLHIEGSARSHYAAHLLAFFVLTMGVAAALHRTEDVVWRSVALCCAFGVTLEVIEHLIFHSPFEGRDVFIDCVAACAAGCVFVLLRRWRRSA
jgi:hypothetical protein